MSNLSIKDVPEQWAETLRQRAARNHRSLQGELMAIIEAAVQGGATASEPMVPPSNTYSGHGTVVGFDSRGKPIRRMGWKTVAQIVAEIKADGLEPDASLPRGVDIIRAERDAR